MKNNGDIVKFLRQKEYIVIDNNLGGGSFGKTVLLKDPFIDELFVAKKYRTENDEDKEKYYHNFIDEIKIMYKLGHPNVVRIYNYYLYESYYTGYIIMEYIEGDDIKKYIDNYSNKQDVTLDNIFIQLIDGFEYIEKMGVIHRDIREGNILIDKNGRVKIIDFGIGKFMFNNKSIDLKDSLVEEINRENSNTLPMEYYNGIYSSKTDMFYLAELLERLFSTVDNNDFSYEDILKKMREVDPDKRYKSFKDVKMDVNERKIVKMSITDTDKVIYQNFTNNIMRDLDCYTESPVYIDEPCKFISKLEDVIRNNIFEDEIQKNSDIIRCIVESSFQNNECAIFRNEDISQFINWYRKYSYDDQELILSNIIYKLMRIDVNYDFDRLPFN